MKTRRIGSSCILFSGWYTWANPILENDNLREDFDRDYNVKPIERTYQPRRAKDVTGEKGRRIDVTA